MNSVPEISLKWELENVHPLIKRLFSTNKVPNVLIAGSLKHFTKAWEKLTRDQSILDLANGYVIPFQSKTPFQLAEKSRTTKTYRQGSEGNVKEESNKTSQYSKGRVFK